MFPEWETGKHARYECLWKNASAFCWRLLKLTGVSSVPGSTEGNPTWITSLVKVRAIFNPLEREPTCLEAGP